MWRDAVGREAIDCAIRSLYEDLNSAVAERSPVCDASGRCCNFEAYGHRLYVTGLEIAWFLARAGGPRRAAVESKQGASPGLSLPQFSQAAGPEVLATSPVCPYQIDGLCSTHAIRPLGCRVFFCEPGTETWQQDTTERFLDRLKRLHAEHGLPYAYMEWRAGLAEAGRVLQADQC